MHQTRSTVNSNSWATPTSPEPILCDPVSPAALPIDEEDEFGGYERFNKFLGQIHQESKIHLERRHAASDTMNASDGPHE